MENRNTILGISRKKVNFVHRIMLIAILHSSVVAPSQNLIIDYINYKPLRYSGSKMNDESKKPSASSAVSMVGSSQLSEPSESVLIKNKEKESEIEYVYKSEKDLSYTLSSDISNGIIGVTDVRPLDDAGDNLFKFYIKDLPTADTKIFLTYELSGVQDCNGVSRSINDRPSTGGYIVKNQMGWTSQREEINLNWLKEGVNKVMFGIPKEARYQYQIKNLKLEFDKQTSNATTSNLVVNAPSVNYIKDNQLYVKGFLRNYDSGVKVYIEDTPLTITDGEYEGFLKLTDALKNRKFIMIKAVDSKGLLGQELISLDNLAQADQLFVPEKNFDKVVALAKAQTNVTLKADGVSLFIKDNILSQDKEISITKLRNIDIAPMASGMINVTKGGYAHRFLPDGTKFAAPVKLTIEYDEKLIPKGHTANDINTFYFDIQQKAWIAVKRDTINKAEKSIVSYTDHFTDYVNGIIQTPESPETAGFTPTMMNDIKAADPSSEMTIISPPEVSQKGDANISYPIKIPAGRKGLQPQLGIQYSNEGGNGWLGQGWNISVPSIAIDTRWGVPVFDSANESEIYTLGGEQLMYPKVGGNDWMPNRHNDVAGAPAGTYTTQVLPRVSNLQFTPRKQGSFAKIERLGTTTKNYYWKVTTTDGTVNWYGGKTGVEPNAVIKNSKGDVVHWALYMTDDIFGNRITYTYDNRVITGQSGQNENLNNGVVFHIQNIQYNGTKDAAGKYEVIFNPTTAIRQDVSINQRLGVKQIEPYFLDNILIRKTGSATPIRKYTFKTGYGKFSKGRLEAVTEWDKAGKEFYTHTFDYYDDITKPDGSSAYFTNGIRQTICGADTVGVGLDQDSDGILGEADACPAAAGPSTNNGCPVVINNCYYVDFSDEFNEYSNELGNNYVNPTEGIWMAIPEYPYEKYFNVAFYGFDEIIQFFKSYYPTATYDAVSKRLTVFTSQNLEGLEFTPDLGESWDHNFQKCTEEYPPSENAGYPKVIDNCYSFEVESDDLMEPEHVHGISIPTRNSEGTLSYIHIERHFASMDEIFLEIKNVYPSATYDYVTRILTITNITSQIREGDHFTIDQGNDDDQDYYFKKCIQEYPPGGNKGNFKNYFADILKNNQFTLTNGVALPSNCLKRITNGSFLIPGYIPSFDSAASILGSSKSEAISGGFYIGIGIGGNRFTKMTTFGVQVNWGNDKSEAMTALIDINGDGLEDIVTKEGNSLYYKKHVVNRTYDSNNETVVTHSFEAKKPITGIGNFYRSFGRSRSTNFQITYAFGFVGWDKSKSKSETDMFFTDGNGDGLMDIVRDGVVYFNRLDANKNPNFIPDSKGTENLVITAAPKTVTDPAIIEEEDIVYPTFDVVKVWEAPADGQIKIDNNIALTDPTKESVVTVEMKKNNIEIPCGETVNAEDGYGDYTYTVDFGTTTGLLGLTYDSYNVPDKFDILWNGTIYSSGYVGASYYDPELINMGIPASQIHTGDPTTGAGVLSFNKTSAYPTKAVIIVTAPLEGTAWEFTSFCTNGTSKLSANTKGLKGTLKEIKNNFSVSFPIPKQAVNGTTSTGIATNIYINNHPINKDNHSYTLYPVNGLDVNGLTDFIVDIERTYPNSKVSVADDIITIAIRDSYRIFSTIDLKPVDGTAALSYSFTATNPVQPLSKKTQNSVSVNKVAAVNQSNCNETPNELCLLYGTQLNAATSSVSNTLTTNCYGQPLNVRKGDRIYFRVHSVANGNPPVNWNPKVEYTAAGMAAITDANGHKPFSSSYSDGFVLTGKQPVAFPGKSGTVKISWDGFYVNKPTDRLIYQIIKRTYGVPSGGDPENPSQIGADQIIYETTCTQNADTYVAPSGLDAITVTDQSAGGYGNLTQTFFYFKVIASANVDWKKFLWKPKVEFTTDTPISPNTDGSGTEGSLTSTTTVYPVPDYDIYRLFPCGNTFVKKDISGISGGALYIQPTLPGVFSWGDNGKIKFFVKRGTTVVSRREFTITNGFVSVDSSSPIYLGTGGSTASNIEVMYTVDDSESDGSTPSLLNNLALAGAGATLATISNGSTSIPVYNAEVTLYQKPNPKFGSFFRQWGQFMYNPANAPGAAPTGIAGTYLIKEEALETSMTQTKANQLNTDLTNLKNVDQDTMTPEFLQDFQNQHQDYLNSIAFLSANPSRENINGSLTDRWIGVHKENYSSEYSFRAAKLEESIIDIEEGYSSIEQAVLQTGAYAISKFAKGHSNNNFSAGASFFGAGINASVSNGGKSNSLSDYVDYNGDRYPDIVSIDKIQYTNKTGGLYPEVGNDGQDTSTSSSDSKGFGASGSFGKSNDDGGDTNSDGNGFQRFDGFKGNSGAGISGSFTKGNSVTQRVWTDVNGDGLSDSLVTTDDGTIVTLNSGPTTPNTVSNNWGDLPLFRSKSEGISGGVGVNMWNGSFEAGVSLTTSWNSTTNTLADINGDGLLDILYTNDDLGVKLNLGNQFVDKGTWGNYNLKKESASVSASLNVGATFALIWQIWFITFKIPAVSINGTPISTSTNKTKKSITDFDGDGYVDLVEEVEPNEVNVYYSRIRRTDMLKSVTNPLGGTFTIDYKVQAIDYNNPNAKWAMTDLVIEDKYNKVNDGEDVYKKHFIYENGRYDRRERDFYGYKTVKVEDYALGTSGTPTLYRTSVSNYLNQSYFTNGLLEDSYVIKAGDIDKKFSRTQNFYEIFKLNNANNEIDQTTSLPLTYDLGGHEGRRSAVVLLTKTITELYELDASPQITTEVVLKYDQKGRVIEYTNKGDLAGTDDDYTTLITYHNLTNLHIINVPESIKVTAANTGLHRERTTIVDTSNGAITKIRAKNNGQWAETTMTYDRYGNLNYIKYPANTAGQSMSYTYKYDSTYNKYVTDITDAFGYKSTATYDSDLDKVLTTIDLSGKKMIYKYDTFGRNTEIVGANETATGVGNTASSYTLKFEYYPYYSLLPSGSINEDKFVPVALTRHYDQQHKGNDIETYTFIDGLARPIQVKKDIFINTGSAAAPVFVEALSVSGKTSYDEFGRGKQQFHPWWETKTNTTKFLLNEYASTYSALTEYDELDRPVKTIDPEGNISTMQYSLDNDVNGVMAIKTITDVDQNGLQHIVTETYKDVSGKVISTKNQGGTTGSIWTKFEYNAIGELMSYTDTENITTVYEYDMFGRKKSVQHPDSGLTTYTYDNVNLVSLQTENLLNKGTFITYKYDINRLIGIDYPNTPTGQPNVANVEYKYGLSTGPVNQKGRLIWQKDATGTQTFDYGNMGEITSNVRTIVAPNLPTRVFTTTFSYDSWNRLQSMKYPDGEIVAYSYDLGGNLTQMTGTINGLSKNYISRIDYDYFEQKTYMLYGNNTSTVYNYSPALRRLNNLNVKASNGNSLFNNTYQYDKVGNVLNLTNTGGITSNNMGGNYSHTFAYDNLNRLSTATGNFTGSSAQIAKGNDANSNYGLVMEYNNTHGISFKSQFHNKNGQSVEANRYDNDYSYIAGSHKVDEIIDNMTNDRQIFSYDLNGNITSLHKSFADQDTEGYHNYYYWDESNRLRVVIDRDDTMHHYIYDASGERVLKSTSDREWAYENGTLLTTETTIFNGYMTYPNAFMSITPSGVFSKHYYAGTQRVVSRLGNAIASIFEPASCTTCKQQSGKNKDDDDTALKQAQIADLQQYIDVTNKGKVSFRDYTPILLETQEKAIADEIIAENAAAKTKDSSALSKAPPPPPAETVLPIYYYHPDHLGTSTYLSDDNGVAYQFFLNLPYGETMAEQLGTSYYKTPYKFNGKELDEETGLYYYGARYYDPKISMWLSVDPLAEKHPDENPYIYCGQNPVAFIDPDGRDRIYSASGRFIKDTGKGNLIKVRIGKKNFNLSELDYGNVGTQRAVRNIIATEAKVLGYGGKYGVKKLKDAGAQTENKKDVFVNTESLKKGDYDDYNTLRNVLSHEADPVFGHRSEIKIKPADYTYLDHSKVYLGQALAPDFKDSSLDNQITTAIGFAERIFATTQKEQGLNVSDYIKEFNKNNGRVSIEGINTNNGTMTYSIDGQVSNSEKIIIPAKPTD
ncbi:MAG: SpvB/TcaC N-terminal domain-containing protein [Bacteroidota bacterium]